MYDTRPKVCAICGKVFFPSPLHMYKKRWKRKVYITCSYKCYTELLKSIDGQKRQ